MAKYEIHHSCGHTTTQQLFGKTADREQKISWWKSVDCPECYKKGREKVRAEEREEENKAAEKWLKNHPELPEIEGSEKQIAWANTIRAEILAEAERIIKGIHTHKDKLNGDWMLNLVDRWFDELLNQTLSSWWIDHRNQTGDQVLSSRNIPAMFNMVWEGNLPKNNAQSLLRSWLDEQPEVIEYRIKIKKEEQKKAAEAKAKEDIYVQSILSILNEVDWKAAVKTFDADLGGFDVHINGRVVEVGMVNDWLEVRSIDGQNKLELGGRFIDWFSARPEIQKVSKMITEYWQNEIKSPLKTFIVGDRLGSIVKNTDDPDYHFLTVQSKDGRTATIVMWEADEWELVEINGKDIPGKMRKSPHALRIVEDAREQIS